MIIENSFTYGPAVEPDDASMYNPKLWAGVQVIASQDEDDFGKAVANVLMLKSGILVTLWLDRSFHDDPATLRAIAAAKARLLELAPVVAC